MQEEETRLTVRLPARVAEVLRRLAAQHRRSFNSEIVWALEEYAERHAEGMEAKDGQG